MARLNNALSRRASGWAVFVEAQRIARPVRTTAFPTPHQRWSVWGWQDAFEEVGAHFESRYFLTFVWLPPAEDASRIGDWLYEGRAACILMSCSAASSIGPTASCKLVEGFMPEVAWLDDGETLTYLRSTMSTRQQHVRAPETPMLLDA